jgi:hypothetical protein
MQQRSNVANHSGQMSVPDRLACRPRFWMVSVSWAPGPASCCCWGAVSGHCSGGEHWLFAWAKMCRHLALICTGHTGKKLNVIQMTKDRMWKNIGQFPHYWVKKSSSNISKWFCKPPPVMSEQKLLSILSAQDRPRDSSKLIYFTIFAQLFFILYYYWTRKGKFSYFLQINSKTLIIRVPSKIVFFA